MANAESVKAGILFCCEQIAETARTLGLEVYSLSMRRYNSKIGQLERINELKAKLCNLEDAREALYGKLNAKGVVVDDDLQERELTLLTGVEKFA